jgi:hypothetical protein
VSDWHWISREDLLRWADSAGSDQQLPTLIRRLILETGNGVELLTVPGGSGVSTGGFDGFVRAASGSAFVPQGVSVWELSVHKSAQGKADDDYTKRLTVPDGSPTKSATYVEVIARLWTKHLDWAKDRTAEGRWREVKAYNVDGLEAWLEQAPATTTWFAEVLGRPVYGVRTEHDWWGGWTASTTTPLGPGILLAGRDGQVEALVARALSGPAVTTIGGDVRVEEIRAFVAGSAEWAAREGKPDLQAQLLFVDDRAAFRRLLKFGRPLTLLVPGGEFAEDLSPGMKQQVLVPVPSSDRADVVLPPVDAREVTDALRAAGLEWAVAAELGRLARRSLLALRRRLAVRPELHRPSWSAPGADSLRRRILLLTSWNQASAGDREMVAQLVRQDYEAIEDELRKLAGVPEDPMVSVVDERWHVVSPMDAWLLLGAQLTRSDLEQFREAALTVLGEVDPALSLPVEDRWRAAYDGISRRYSYDLREGLARSLALLGAVDDVVQTGSGWTGSAWASRIVAELLEQANADASFNTWASLAGVLPLLAEAAPTEFLNALHRGLEGSPPLLAGMFMDGERDEFGSPRPSAHTGFLWALERLAWSPDHFNDAVLVLGRLALLDPGGAWANRPSATLSSSFCPWHPNTSAPAEQRLAVLNRLRRRAPQVAWRLMISMLPNTHEIQTLNDGPAYRAWKDGEPVVTSGEYWAVVDAVAGRLIEDLATDVERHVDLVKEAADLPPPRRTQLCEVLVKFAAGTTDTERAPVWSALREVIAHHREFRDAKWALPDTELERLEAAEEKLRPSSPSMRHEWLFTDGLVTLGDIQRRDDFQAYEEALSDRRRDAVAEILAESGLEEVIAFADASAIPGLVGAALARAAPGRFDGDLARLLEPDEGPRLNLAFGYFTQRFRDEGWSWLDRLISGLTSMPPQVVARLLRTSWDPIEGARRADSLGSEVADHYWRELSYLGLGHDFPAVTDVAARLAQVGRHAAALDLLALYAHTDRVDDDYAEAVAAAFEGLMAAETPDPGLSRLQSYQYRVLLDVLAKHRNTLGLARVIRIEWFFLPALGYHPDAQTLHRALTEDPSFFVEMMRLMFRPSSGASEDKASDISEQHKLMAENAFRLVWSWSTCPGTDENGQIDAGRLLEWVGEARRLLIEADRLDIGDQYIGQALASAPADLDGTWPTLAVRDLLEDIHSDHVDKGFEIGVYNSRGVVSRDPEAGGTLERELAQRYREHAERLRDTWPRSAAMCRRLADTYEVQARREDAQAERRRRGLGS